MSKKNAKIHALDGAEMTAEGLSFKGSILEPVVEQCDGCERAIEFDSKKYCPSYAQPAKKWSHGVCNFATHARAGVDKEGKVKVNPLKASKRAARGR
ncbi:PxxKW family cysteine-rich protein [Desulfovibrio sp. UCD-KL4C]|uniref:PxxKW family cysteine-rich protein n=1 Tax=Desulfovibrio sp. UCD-KL4C TaxID=2578120 RepID=UPI0025BD1045|nr:PxxKW family cysteine-rich protein [Desulfovibrio sp. UCD-KL4C]